MNFGHFPEWSLAILNVLIVFKMTMVIEYYKVNSSNFVAVNSMWWIYFGVRSIFFSHFFFSFKRTTNHFHWASNAHYKLNYWNSLISLLVDMIPICIQFGGLSHTQRAPNIFTIHTKWCNCVCACRWAHFHFYSIKSSKNHPMT